MTTANCSTCSAQIIWTRTERGHAMPVEQSPAVRVAINDVPAITPGFGLGRVLVE